MKHITLAHGNGGRHMRELIEDLFKRGLNSPLLDTGVDAAAVPGWDGDLVISVDAYTVQPLEFPGGNIGALAVHGTINDLAVSGARARYMSVSAIIEEGLDLDLLHRIIDAAGRAARQAGVDIVCGDTKVVARGEGGGLYLTTTGMGRRVSNSRLSMTSIRPGDCILVSGPVGDHGTAIMLARAQFGLSGDVRSDCANVAPLCAALYDLPGLRFLRDPTRGGLATVLHEVRHGTGLGILVREADIPLRPEVSAMCAMLGFDPYYLACEGRVLAVVTPESAATALLRWRALPGGTNAALIGEIADTGQDGVELQTTLGGRRYLDELEDDPLPRIC